MKEKLIEQTKNTGNVYLTALRYVAMILFAAVGLRLSFSFAMVLGRVKVKKVYSYAVILLFTILLTVGMSLTAGMITSLYLLICNWS